MTSHRGSDTERLRHELADRLDVLPPRTWEPELLQAVCALLDIYIEGGAANRPASVLHLVSHEQ